jgi:hypothetical protein
LPHPTDGRAALVELTDDGVRAAAALARDEREFAQYLFADRTTGDLSNLAVGLDQLLARLNDPAYATLRRSALRRWPLTPVRPAHQAAPVDTARRRPIELSHFPGAPLYRYSVQGLVAAERAGQVHEAEQDVGGPLVADLHPWRPTSQASDPPPRTGGGPAGRWTRCRAWRSSGVIPRRRSARRPRG